MGSKKFTFIELHLDGNTQFGPKTISDKLPIGDSEEAEHDEQDEEAVAGDEDSGKGSAIGALIGLIALVAIAVAVKKRRGSDDEGTEGYDEPEIITS
ncbi:hypothetical protein OB919_00580 [Halobacteria archaeon AArc-curdl1]|uniref:Uncharacterized protein n=1 Tax=Natronosalvus hydrolyticus TaxID=2979988 RepID=A0AAP2Z4N4_9EURY|nr:hypothetical protein [Halobacteria archaeon AArc-curdl1]